MRHKQEGRLSEAMRTLTMAILQHGDNIDRARSDAAPGCIREQSKHDCARIMNIFRACHFALTSILLLAVAVIQPAAHAQNTPYTFEQLFDDGGLTLEVPAGFERRTPEANDVLSYEYALQHEDKKLAVRYAIRPINMVEIDYEDPHNAAPELNHLFPMLFQSLISLFSRGGSSPSNEYSASDAQAKFNADWAAVAVMDVTRDFSEEYDQVLLLALHKNNASDAYVIVLFDDYVAVKPEINTALGSLKFK